MSKWPSSKAKAVLKALQKIGYTIKTQKGSHVQLTHPTKGPYTLPYHAEELGPAMMAKIGKKTGLTPEDL